MRTNNAIINIITNLILQVVVIIYGFIIPQIIIKSFGSEVNGLLSSITQFLSYITLLESGFGPVVKAVLYKPIASKDTKTIEGILKTTEKFFRTIALIFLIYISILCGIYPIIVSNNFSHIYSSSLIIIIGISTFAEYFFGMTYRLYLQANQKYYIISSIQIITYILSIIIIIILDKMGTSIHIIKLFGSLIFVLRPILQNFYVKKKYNISFKKANSNHTIKQKWDGLAQHIASVIHSNTDITILTLLGKLKDVSIYSVYYLVVSGVRSVILSFAKGFDSIFGNMVAKEENENLREKFNIYETLYLGISNIAFASTIILIVPFISIYTVTFNDANYVIPFFGILITISEYIWIIRQPYNELIKAAGHFKETRIGAWIECIVNIIVSAVMVNYYGIIGVVIGTIVAMSIRTIEFVCYSNKYILKRSVWTSWNKIIVLIIGTITSIIACNILPNLNNTNYLNWFFNAIIIVALVSVITVILNFIFFRNDIIKSIKMFLKVLNKKEIT